ncbi:MAG: NADH-quinone oxidoreductase subunit C [Planctomycetota bacterium]
MPSVCGVWRGANWHEREVYDLSVSSAWSHFRGVR